MLKRILALVLVLCLAAANAPVPIYAVTLHEHTQNLQIKPVEQTTVMAAGETKKDPITLEAGNTSFDVPKRGYNYFLFTAPADGTLTVTIHSSTGKWYYLVGSSGKWDIQPESQKMKSGDSYLIAVRIYNSSADKYGGAAGTITLDVSFVSEGGEPVDPPVTECAHDWADASCTAPKTCKKCGITEGEALGHDWADASCTAPKTCKKCGSTEGEALGHTEQTIPGKDATCTEPGLTEGKQCSVCGEILTEQTKIDAKGHNYIDGTCTHCGDTIEPPAPTDPEVTEPTEPDVTEPTETMEAQIGDAKYETLKEAIDAAQDGDVIILLSDVNGTAEDYVQLDEEYKTWLKVEGKSITIDLNGKTIFADATMMGKGDPHTRTEDGYGIMIDWTGDKLDGMLVGVFATSNNGHLTLKDSSPAQTGTVSAQSYNDVTDKCGIVYALLVNYKSGCSITVESGNYKLDIARDSLIYSGCSHGEGEGVMINGGTFQLGNVGQGRNQSPWIFNVKGRDEGHAHINGGSFNTDIRNQYWIFEAQMSGNKTLVYNEETQMYDTAEAKYMVNMQYKSGKWYTYEKGYLTLAEAVAAAQSNAASAAAAGKSPTVTMLADDAGAGANIDFDMTIDFGGHTFTVTEGIDGGTNGFVIAKGCSVILRNGTVQVELEQVDVLIWNDGDLRLRKITLDGTGLAKTGKTKVIGGKGYKSEDGETDIIQG